MFHYEGTTIGDVYEKIVKDVFECGIRKNPRGKWTRELHPVTIELENSGSNKFLLIPNRGINYAFAMAEIMWILSGRGDYEFIGFYNKNMKSYLDDIDGFIDMKGLTTKHDFHSAYGKRIRRANYTENQSFTNFPLNKFRGINRLEEPALFDRLFMHGIEIDQLQMVYDKLQEDMNSRQAIVSLWDVRKDNLFKSADYPCNTMLMFSVNKGELDLSVIRRSNDVIWGLPYNIVQFTSIQEYMAGWLGLETGRYIEFINSLHVYEEEYPEILEFVQQGVENNNLVLPDFPRELMYAQDDRVRSKAEMDRFLTYFFKTEAEWRLRIKPETHKEVLKLYIDRWLGELNSVTNSHYWLDVYTFLLTYHLYKTKHYEMVLEQTKDSQSILFKFMAVETFRKASEDLIKELLSFAKRYEMKLYKSLAYYYKEA